MSSPTKMSGSRLNRGGRYVGGTITQLERGLILCGKHIVEAGIRGNITVFHKLGGAL